MEISVSCPITVVESVPSRANDFMVVSKRHDWNQPLLASPLPLLPPLPFRGFASPRLPGLDVGLGFPSVLLAREGGPVGC